MEVSVSQSRPHSRLSIFFIVCGLTGVHAVLLFAPLGYWHRRKQPPPVAAL